MANPSDLPYLTGVDLRDPSVFSDPRVRDFMAAAAQSMLQPSQGYKHLYSQQQPPGLLQMAGDLLGYGQDQTGDPRVPGSTGLRARALDPSQTGYDWSRVSPYNNVLRLLKPYPYFPANDSMLMQALRNYGLG